MGREWYYVRAGQSHGPLTGKDMQKLVEAGQLLPNDLIWSKGMSKWVEARKVPQLFTGKVAPAHANRAIPPLPAPSEVSGSPTQRTVFRCPQCKKALQVAPAHCGLPVQCPLCKTSVLPPSSVPLSQPNRPAHPPAGGGGAAVRQDNPFDFADKNAASSEELNDIPRTTKYRKSLFLRSDRVKMSSGLLLWLLGTMVTGVSYLGARHGALGGFFVLAWGPMLMGPVMFTTGFSGWLQKRLYLSSCQNHESGAGHSGDLLAMPSLSRSIVTEISAWCSGLAVCLGSLGLITGFEQEGREALPRSQALVSGLVTGIFIGIFVGMIRGIYLFGREVSEMQGLEWTHKLRILSGWCALLLGAFGLHKYILGRNTQGTIVLVATIATCGIAAPVLWILGLVEGIVYLTRTNEQFHRQYVVKKKGWL